MRLRAAASALLLAACHGGDRCEMNLVDPFQWKLVDPPGSASACTDAATTVEPVVDGTPSFSVTTLDCSHATAAQPLLLVVDQGEMVHLRIYHFALMALGEEADASISIAIEGNEVWSESVPVGSRDDPTAEGLIEEDFAMPFGTRASAPILWTVRNHGTNSWNFVDLTVMRDCTTP